MFSKYLKKFEYNETNRLETHLAFNGKKYIIPDEFINDFYNKYFECLQKNEEKYEYLDLFLNMSLCLKDDIHFQYKLEIKIDV